MTRSFYGEKFTKQERLNKKKIIQKLWMQKTSFFKHPFRVLYLYTELPSEYPVQLLISVPKKHIKKAVDRNLIKRRVREAYRKQKLELYNHLAARNKQMALALVYNSQEILSYEETQRKIKIILQRLIQKDEKDIQ